MGDPSTVVDVMKCDKTFGILKAAATEAGLLDVLTSPDEELTVFAPTNKAFVKALDQLGLTKEEMLADILSYHVVPGKIKSDDIAEGETKVESVLGLDLIVTADGDGISINEATVEYADLEAENGVVHVIDEVLLPPTLGNPPDEDRDEDKEPEKPVLG